MPDPRLRDAVLGGRRPSRGERAPAVQASAPPQSVGDALESLATTTAETSATLSLRRRRQNGVVLVLATARGLWLGVAAPGVSPVSPAVATTVRGSNAPAVPGDLGQLGVDGGRG